MVEIGRKYGRLTVIRKTRTIKHGESLFECLCDCGNTKELRGSSVFRGITRSCGCLAKETHAGNSYTKTHGESKIRLFRIWFGIKERCFNTKCHSFISYGGRGINMSEEWAQSYVRFRDWAISHGYGNTLTIDRIDNSLGYFPSNCRWVTNKEQQRNKTNNRYLTINGQTKKLFEWAEQAGVNYRTLHGRLQKGFSPEEVIFGRIKRVCKTYQ